MALETARTLLRPFEKGDLDDLHTFSSQEGVGEMAGWKHHASLSESEKVLEENCRNPDIFAIEYKDESRVIGHIAIYDDSENCREDTKELGFVLNRDYHNHGIMTEVVKAVLQYLFSNQIEFVYACCFQENEASRHLIEKCGFTFEQEGAFYSDSLRKEFQTYEYVIDKQMFFSEQS